MVPTSAHKSASPLPRYVLHGKPEAALTLASQLEVVYEDEVGNLYADET